MNVSEQVNIKEPGELHWYAVHVRSRHEFSVAERLVKLGIRCLSADSRETEPMERQEETHSLSTLSRLSLCQYA